MLCNIHVLGAIYLMSNSKCYVLNCIVQFTIVITNCEFGFYFADRPLTLYMLIAVPRYIYLHCITEQNMIFYTPKYDHTALTSWIKGFDRVELFSIKSSKCF